MDVLVAQDMDQVSDEDNLRQGRPIVKRNAPRRIRVIVVVVILRLSIVTGRLRMLLITVPGEFIGALFAIVYITMRPSVPGEVVSRAFPCLRILASKNRPRGRTP